MLNVRASNPYIFVSLLPLSPKIFSEKIRWSDLPKIELEKIRKGIWERRKEGARGSKNPEETELQLRIKEGDERTICVWSRSENSDADEDRNLWIWANCGPINVGQHFSPTTKPTSFKVG